MKNITVITTFNQEGLNLYAQKFITSFEKHVDKKIKLICYAENCAPIVKDTSHIEVLNAKNCLPDLVRFKKKYKKIPYANGVPPEHIRVKRPRDSHKEFKWDAIRFANKTYAVFESARTCKDWIVWMDADTVVHSDWTFEEFQEILPNDKWITFVGRGKSGQTWPECGFYGLNLDNQICKDFINDFELMYQNAENGIFTLEEWHDSFVFGHVLNQYKTRDLNFLDYTEDLDLKTARTGGGGHPLINCVLGRWLDHLKGARKIIGKSNKKDLSVVRTEKYWNT